MATTDELYKYVLEHLGVVLEEDDLWSDFADRLNLNAHFSSAFILGLADFYPEAVRKNPNAALVAEPLMQSVMTHLLIQYRVNANTHYANQDTITMIFDAWTLCGSIDISDKYANDIFYLTQSLYSVSSASRACVLDMVARSTALWSTIKSTMIKNVEAFPQYIHVFTESQLVFHRHIPHRIDLHDPKKVVQMYELMCGANTDVKPTLLELRSVLMGPHNNALAWHTALAVCDLKDPTMVGSWMKMLPAFSMLRLDTTEPDSWQFWHLLCDSTKDNASGRKLMVALSKAKPPMSQAYADAWSSIDALFEGNTRYAQASKTHASIKVNPLALPTMFPQEHMLE